MKLLRRILHHKATIPVAIFVLLVAALVYSLSRSERPPRLESISPEIGTPGGVLVLKGKYFGNEQLSSAVSISGTRPTSHSYLEWTDTRVSVQIPEDAGTGMVYISTRLGTSEGLLFTNKNRIPVVISETAKPGVPFIETMSPTVGTVGEVITVRGLNFGLSRGAGRVLFTSLAAPLDLGADREEGPEYLPASELDFDYDSWTDQEILVRVPDGATSGNVYVETDRGQSNTVYFEVANLPGTKMLRSKTGYQITFSVEISDVKANTGSTIDLWVAGPLRSLEQRNIEYIKIPDPLWDDYHGLSRYQIADPLPETTYRVNQTFWLDRYGLETKISTSKVGRTYDVESKLYQVYTSSNSILPVDDESVVNAAKSAIGRERNPYLQARAIYLFLIKQLAYDAKPDGKTILENYVSATADAYTYTMLFCAMSRAIGIPARPVAGFLIYGDKRRRIHYWAEYYLAGFGWAPVDPTLGDGVRFEEYPDEEDPTEFFFGNTDSHHLVFTRGLVDVRPLSSEARTVTRERVYSLQTIHEESSKGVASYSAQWSSLQVIDLW